MALPRSLRSDPRGEAQVRCWSERCREGLACVSTGGAVATGRASPIKEQQAPRTIEFQINNDLAPFYQLKVSLLFELQSIPALRVTINGKSGIFYPEPKLDDRMGNTSAAYDPIYSSADIAFAFPGPSSIRGQIRSHSRLSRRPMKPSQVLDSHTTQSNWTAWLRNQSTAIPRLESKLPTSFEIRTMGLPSLST